MSDPTIWDDGFIQPSSTATVTQPYTDNGIPTDVNISVANPHSTSSRGVFQGTNGRSTGKYFFEVWLIDPANNSAFVGLTKNKAAAAGNANLANTNVGTVETAISGSSDLAAARLRGISF